MNLQTFKALFKEGKVNSLEPVHERQYASIIDPEAIVKSEARWFIFALDTHSFRSEGSLKKQAQIEFDNFIFFQK